MGRVATGIVPLSHVDTLDIDSSGQRYSSNLPLTQQTSHLDSGHPQTFPNKKNPPVVFDPSVPKQKHLMFFFKKYFFPCFFFAVSPPQKNHPYISRGFPEIFFSPPRFRSSWQRGSGWVNPEVAIWVLNQK